MGWPQPCPIWWVCHLAQTFQIYSEVNNFKKIALTIVRFLNLKIFIMLREQCFSLKEKIFQFGDYFSKNEKKNIKMFCAVKGFFCHFLK
jgi:hypothetical protein